jgi:hypothetical protein
MAIKRPKTAASIAIRVWILASVFIVPFLDRGELIAWAVLGGVIALAWWRLPEDPPAPVERLPYQHLYERRDAADQPPAPRE